MRFFNTAGPVDPKHHYVLDPLHRWNLKQVLALIEQSKYFLLHAPRQTGKTTCMYALRDYLNEQGKEACVYLSLEAAQADRENLVTGMQTILAALASRSRLALGDDFVERNRREILAAYPSTTPLQEMLSLWCGYVNKLIVLLIDECLMP